MKKLLTLLCISILIVSCSKEEDVVPTNELELNTIFEGGQSGTTSNIIGQVDLVAGQNMDAGFVSVTADRLGSTANFETDTNWEILETHVYIGPLDDIPLNNNGSPKIGQFPYTSLHPNGVRNVRLPIDHINVGSCPSVVMHAVVRNMDTGDEETAWGEGNQINFSSWAMYFDVCN